MATDWYYTVNNQRHGPISTNELKQLVATNFIQPSDLLWKEGLKDWVPARMAQGLFPILPSAVSASPPAAPQAISLPLPPAIRSSSSPPDGPKSTDAALDRLHNDVFNMEEAAQPFDFGLQAAGAALGEFKSLDYGFLVPLKKVFSTSMLKKKAVRWVLAFGLFPLLVCFIKDQFNWTFEQCVWILGGYFCLFWATYFYGILSPSPNVWRRGVKWAIFTVMVGLPLLFIAQKLPVIKTFYSGTESNSLLVRLAGFIFGVGLLEETCKALPLLLFALRKNEKLSLKDGIFLGMMSGFGFALAEVVQYSVTFWDGSAAVSAQAIAIAVDKSTTWRGTVDASAFANQMRSVMPQLSEFYGNMVLAQIVRFMTLPLLHAVWAGIVGWFIATASVRKDKARAIVIVGILFMAVMHGVYDVFSSGIIGIAIAATSILLFMGYVIHGQDQATTPISQPTPPS